MGDDVITAATGIPMLTILLHGATTALRVPTRLSIQNTLVVCRFGVADRTTRPIIDSREAIAPCRYQGHALTYAAHVTHLRHRRGAFWEATLSPFARWESLHEPR